MSRGLKSCHPASVAGQYDGAVEIGAEQGDIGALRGRQYLGMGMTVFIILATGCDSEGRRDGR